VLEGLLVAKQKGCWFLGFMAAQGKPTCETEINFLVDLDDSGDVLPETIPRGLRERFPDDAELQAEVRRKKLVAVKALTEWADQLKVVEAKLSRRTKRLDCLTNEIYQLVGLYRVQCQHVWSPILLCLLPCFIIAYVIEKKLVTIHRIRKENNVDELSRRVGY
jgi:hypothetical protein